MKICLLNSLYPPYQRGGAEKVCAQMAQNLKNEGHSVFIISGRPKKPLIENKTTEKIYYIPSNFYHLNEKNIIYRLLWHLQNLFSFKSLSQVLAILKNEKPDLIISHNLIGLGFMSALAIKASAIPHHHFIHDIQLLHPSGLMIYGQEKKIDSQVARFYRTILRKIIASPQKVISPSKWLLDEHLRRNFFSNSKTEIQKLDNIFAKNNPSLNLVKSRLNIKQEEKNKAANIKLLFAGQIESHKGIIFLIKAFLEKKQANLELDIAGSGSQLALAKDMSKSDQRIKFLGNLNKEALEQKMLKSDALIVPSLCYENSPLIISEAKALGLKVIAARIGGIPEATPNPELLFSPNSSSDLFDKILSLTI